MENDLLHSNKEKEIKERINKYLDVDRKDNAYVSDLDDLNSGKDINRANEEGEVLDPPTVDNTSNPEPEPKSPTPPPVSAPIIADPEGTM